MALTSVAEGGAAKDQDAHCPFDAMDAPTKMPIPGRLGRKPYGHEILQFSNSIRKQESRHEDVGGRPIELLVPHVIANRANLKVTSFVVIQNCPKNAW